MAVKNWKKGEYILNEYDFFVVKRGDVNFVRYKKEDVVSELGSTMSATLVRDRISEGKSIDYLVPKIVKSLIFANEVYK